MLARRDPDCCVWAAGLITAAIVVIVISASFT